MNPVAGVVETAGAKVKLLDVVEAVDDDAVGNEKPVGAAEALEDVVGVKLKPPVVLDGKLKPFGVEEESLSPLELNMKLTFGTDLVAGRLTTIADGLGV